MNTYHAHLMPWLDGGALVVSVSQNARDMGRHAFPHPERYRLQFFAADLADVPPPHDRTVDDGRAGRAADDGDHRATADRAPHHADRADHAGHLDARPHGAADDACPAVDTADDRRAGDDDQLVSHDVDDVDDDRPDDHHDDDHRVLDVVDHVDVNGAVRAVIGVAPVRRAAPAAPRRSTAAPDRRSCDRRRPTPLHAPATAASRTARPRRRRRPAASGC